MKMELKINFIMTILFLSFNTVSLWGLEIGLSIQTGKLVKQDNGKMYMEFPVVMSATPSVPIEFSYFTTDITAKSNKNYIPTRGNGIIQAHEKKALIQIPIIDEKQFSGSKSFSITLSSKLTPVFIPKAMGIINEKDISLLISQKSIIKDPL